MIVFCSKKTAEAESLLSAQASSVLVWMSVVGGQKRKSPRWNGMSVLPSTTDIVRPPRHVRFVPSADFHSRAKRAGS
jgi:hypothetical protein